MATSTAFTINRSALVDILSAPQRSSHPSASRGLGLELERFVIDRQAMRTVAYADEPGIHDLLRRWGRFFSPDERTLIDGHLFGYVGHVVVNGEAVGISISLEPGSQLEASVGPCESAEALLGALEAFDAQFELVTSEMGVDWQLVAEGFNPLVTSPFEVPIIDKERYHLMDAYLSRTGRYARDMMRCSTSTQISIDLPCGFGREGQHVYQLSVALGPLLSFLTDNTVNWRGLAPEDTPRMARARIWEHMDPARCGTVPGTFSDSFGPDAYVEWLCGVQPILFTDEEGSTVSTGDATEADLLASRPLGPHELAHLLSMVFPDTRLKGFAEMRTPDSLPPALAGSLAAFVRGLFYSSEALAAATHLLVEGTLDADVGKAWEALKNYGWDASIYGRPVAELVDELMELAFGALEGDPDQALLEGLFSLWRARSVPRDAHLVSLVESSPCERTCVGTSNTSINVSER